MLTAKFAKWVHKCVLTGLLDCWFPPCWGCFSYGLKDGNVIRTNRHTDTSNIPLIPLTGLLPLATFPPPVNYAKPLLSAWVSSTCICTTVQHMCDEHSLGSNLWRPGLLCLLHLQESEATTKFESLKFQDETICLFYDFYMGKSLINRS